MASQWFCKVLGQEIGPVGFREMVEMVRAGTLKEEDPIRRDGTSEWIRAREVIGLFRAAAKERATTPPEAEAEPQAAEAVKPNQAEQAPSEPRRVGRRQVLLAGGLIVGLVLLVAAVSAWRANRRERFPEPGRLPPQVVQEDLVSPLAAQGNGDALLPVPRDRVPGAAEGAAVEMPARFTLDFREEFDPRALELIAGASPDRYYAVEPAGLRVKMPEDGELSYCAAAPRIRVKGDFQITARYTILSLPAPQGGYGTGISLFVEDLQGERAGVGRKIRVHEGHVFMGYRGKRQPDGTYQHPTRFHDTSSDVSSGWLRLRRVGRKIQYQVADRDGERFVQIHEEEFPPGEVANVRLVAQTGGSPTVIDAVWSYLDVQAGELVKEYPPEKGAKS